MHLDCTPIKLDPDATARFWAKVCVKGADDCWFWIGAVARSGYGSFRHGGRKGKIFQSHRVAFTLEHHDPADKHVLHSCDTPRCCNPKHLSTGTHKQNIEDMAKKGRNRTQRKGNGHTKLSSEDRLLIKNAYLTNPNKSQIARMFGVSPPRIRQILQQHGIS